MNHYLTFGDLRQKLRGRARSSIYRDVEQGYLPPPFKIGRINFWHEAEVEAALEQHRVQPNKPKMADQ